MKVLCYLLFISILLSACGDKPVPRPKAYFRIDFPEKSYEPVESECPFVFEKPVYSALQWRQNPEERCWFTMHLPRFRAQLHFTYKPVEGNLRQLLEESHHLSYEHHIKANDIITKTVIRDSSCVYGLSYQLLGDVASPVQFYLTDSTNHFLRGSLYFNAAVNSDSLQPVVDFISADVDRLIETMQWRESKCE